ncbi:PA14 domain-containing protein (plasmid) [Spirosoma oryzicola]|nr:PA14 domain-containing protein [Spirosoma oryzicola]
MTTTLGGMLLSLPLWAQGGLKGDYYRGTTFEQKVQTRIDTTIHFDWSTRAPLPELEGSYYSIRWTGELRAPVSGPYTFYCQVDDGLKLWVGQQLLINEWHLSPYSRFKGQIQLVAGQTYPIRIDYFNAIQVGRITLRWERPDQPLRWFGWLREPGEPIPTAYLHPPSRLSPARQPGATVGIPPGSRAKRSWLARPKRGSTGPPWADRPPARSVAGRLPPEKRPNATAAALVTPFTMLFGPSSYGLTRASLQQLDSVLVYWKKAPPGWIEVIGHADRVGDRVRNRTLSEYRTRVVIAHLTRQGIAPAQLRGRWEGDEQPLILDSAPALRAQNRRVLIRSHYD